MTIYYIDPVDGNNSNDGLTFATRKKSLKSAINSSGQHEYRVIETAGGLVSSNSRWVSQFNVPARSLTAATNLNGSGPVGYQITVSSHGWNEGDYLFFYAFNTAQINGWWEITSVIDANTFIIDCYINTQTSLRSSKFVWNVSNHLVKLDSPKTKNLLNGIRGYTPETGVQTVDSWVTSSYCTVSQYYHSSISNDAMTQAITLQMYISSSFQTGKMAYYTFSAPLDLSDYRQLSYYVFQYTGNTTSGPQWKICLCSDTQGNVIEYEFEVPAQGRTNVWSALTIDCDNLPAGQTMTTPINSIAFYCHTDRSTCGMRFQHIIACKDNNEPDCLTHNSVISTKRDGDLWYPVTWVDEDRVIIGTHSPETTSTMTQYSSATSRTTGYWYDTFEPSSYNNAYTEKQIENGLPCYVYNPVNTHVLARGSNILPSNNVDTRGEYLSGRDNFHITGGWNRTDMSTRADDALSWYWSPQASGSAIYCRYAQNYKFENLGFRGGEHGLYIHAASNQGELNNIHCAGGKEGIRAYSTVFGIRVNKLRTVGLQRGIYWYYQPSAISITDWKDRSRLNPLYTYISGDFHIHDFDFRGSNSATFSTSLDSYEITLSEGKALGASYFAYMSSNYRDIKTKNCYVKSVKYFQRTQKSTSYPNTYGIYHHGLDPTLQSSYYYSNNHFTPNPGVSSPSWGQRSQVGYNGMDDPLYRFGFSDGSFVSVGAQVGYQNASQVHSGSAAMECFWESGGSRQRDTYDVQVTNTALGEYSRGRHAKLLIAEVAVNGGGTVTFSAQCKRVASNSDDIQGNLYIGADCGNAEVRSSNLSGWDTWEELSVSAVPTRSGVMKVYLEIKGYYTGYRYIIVDTLSCTQS